MVATVGRARGGPAGVADEPVMSRAPGPPLFPGSHLKSPFLSARAGASGDKGRRRRGRSGTPPFRSAFPVLGPQEAPRAARAPAQHAGRALPLGARRPALR